MITEPLKAFATKYSAKAMDDAPFTALPLGDLIEAEDEQAMKARLAKLAYEVPADDWHPIMCAGTPVFSPTRFIDGSTMARTVALLNVNSVARPALLACVSAMALRLQGRRLYRPPESVRIEMILALLSNGIPNEDLASLSTALKPLGFRLIASETSDVRADFDTLRRRTWDVASHRMEELERAVLHDEPTTPTVVDGLVERHLVKIASHSMPVVGVVKRQMRRYLPDSHLSMLYELKPGERSPSFVIDTEHASVVSWYVRLTAQDRLAPGYGVVRLTCSCAFLEQRFPDLPKRWAEISALSSYLCELRHRQRSYFRMGISLEPIVRLEDELHALMPSTRQMTARLHRALGV